MQHVPEQGLFSPTLIEEIRNQFAYVDPVVRRRVSFSRMAET